MTLKRKVLTTAVASVLGLAVAGAAHSAAVTGIVVQDTDGDGRAGRFGFNALLTSDWTGDVGTGTILGEGNANPTGSFSTGFLFAGSPFIPYTYGANMNADIDAGGNLTFSDLDFGGNYAGLQNFNLAPDGGAVQVNYVNDNGDGTYDVNFQWSHYITSTDDPSGSYVGFTARWLVDGVATVVPVPAAVWLMGSGLVGLGAVARRRRGKQS